MLADKTTFTDALVSGSTLLVVMNLVLLDWARTHLTSPHLTAPQICRADPSVDSLAASALLKEWFLSDGGGAAAAAVGGDAGLDWEEDKSVLAWMENKVCGDGTDRPAGGCDFMHTLWGAGMWRWC